MWVVCREGGEDFLQFLLSPGCLLERSQGGPRASVAGQGMKERASINGLILVFNRYQREKNSRKEEAFASGVHNLGVLWSFQNPDVIEDVSFSRVFAFDLHT